VLVAGWLLCLIDCACHLWLPLCLWLTMHASQCMSNTSPFSDLELVLLRLTCAAKVLCTCSMEYHRGRYNYSQIPAPLQAQQNSDIENETCCNLHPHGA
jgi:hypothetical protein